jgi:MFS family permease
MRFLFLANLFGTFSFAMIMPFTVVYATKVLGISELAWGLLLIFLFVAMIVTALPSGKFIDKIGRKIPLLVSYSIMAPAILLFVFGDFSRLLIALILIGLSQVLVMSAYSSLQADLVPKEKRGKVIGFTNFVNYIFMAIGSVVGSILYSILPQLPFFLVSVLLIPEFLIVSLLVNEPKKRQE